MKYLITYAVVITVVAAVFVHNTVMLLGTNEVTVTYCESVESKVRDMSTDDVNSLMIVAAETLTENYRTATLEQFEQEHKSYANSLALEHMNDVMGVLIRSVGAMPTSTISY